MNKEVEIFNYVVEDSFDANMWEKLKNKASIINQAMSNNTQARAVEDADLVTLGYAEIEGAATGNPLIKEQLQLDSDVKKYTHAQTALKKQQQRARNDLVGYRHALEVFKAALPKIEADTKARSDTKGDKFKATIAGKVYTERTKADTALKNALLSFNSETPKVIGNIGGLNITARIIGSGYSVNGQEVGAKVELQLANNYSYRVNKNSIQGLENTLRNGIDNAKEETEKSIEYYERSIKEAEETLALEYPYTEKLKELQKRLNEVNREIERTLVEEGNKQNSQEEADKNNPEKKDIRYSVSNDTGTKENVSAMTEEQMITEVKQAFPTAKNINADGSSVTFTLPNGHKVTVNYVKRIGLTEAEKRQAAADYGREITDNDVIEGRYHGLGQEAFIEIAEGGREGTINHEAFHYAMEAALTQKMKDFLNKKYNKSEEAMAEAFRKWCNDRAHSDKLGKIWNKVKDFAGSIANLLGIQTKQGIFKDIASGKAFEGMTYDISNTKYALTYNAKVTLFKRIAEHVDAAIKDMQNAGKTDEYIKDQLKGYPNFRESFMQKLHSNYETNVVKDLEGRRLIVERIARHRGIRPGDLDYDEVVKESKELISRAEEYFTQICEDRASNVGFSAGIVTPNDATRIRNGILGSRQVNRRGEKALHSVTTKATTGNGGGSSYAKFSINTNDNSKPGFVQRIRNLFKGEKKNSTEYRRMVQNIMEDLSQCKIRWGKMDEGLASIYKEAQKVIRVAKPYDWANALPNVGYAVAKRLGIEDSATPETSKIANYIADWVMTGAPNNTSQEAKDFAEAMKNNPYMADKLLELQNIFMQYSDKSTHDFHQNVVSFERPREKDYFHNFAMKLYDQFIEELGPVQRMVEGIEKVKKEKIPKNLNPYVAFRLFRGHYGKAMTMVEGTSQKAVEALQRIYPHVDFNGFKNHAGYKNGLKDI